MQPSVFISFNPNSELEQTLAIRLHTIGAVSGYTMLLPDRAFGSNGVSSETQNRINLSDYFIVFSTTPLSEVVRQEIQIAFNKHRDRSRILVVYDLGSKRTLAGTEHCTEVIIDVHQQRADEIVNLIAEKLKKAKTSANENGLMSALGNILLIGVGLFALSEIFSGPPKRRTKARRKSPVKKKGSRLHA